MIDSDGNYTILKLVPVVDNTTITYVEMAISMTPEEIAAFTLARKRVIENQALTLQEQAVDLYNVAPPTDLETTEATLLEQLT